MNVGPMLPCLCQHDWHPGACPDCLCVEYQPDDHQYPISLGWVTS